MRIVIRNAVVAAAALAVGAALLAEAALPPAVDGVEVPSLAPLIDKASPAVVNIATESVVRSRGNALNDPVFRWFFGVPNQPMERKRQGLGSGVIIDAKRGIVVTNNHVIQNADQITVQLVDGRRLEADLVGADPDTDIAVIKIPPEDLTELPVADSDALRVGDFVVAIGNPFGLSNTVTSGIVSAKARSGLGLSGYENFIQTDASINPGNSGGALVNLRGELVGINTAILSPAGGNVGIGLAIPVNMAKQVIGQLVDFGEVRRGFIGAQLQDLDPNLAQAFGVESNTGAVLVDVANGSPAARAGLKAGDIITKVEGKPVTGAADLRNRVGLRRVGESVKMSYVRDGERRETKVEIGDPASLSTAAEGLQNPVLGGATFGEIDPSSPAHGYVDGVMVYAVEQGSPVWRSGLRRGDIITSVNRQQVRTMQEFLQLVNVANGPVLLRIQRGNAAAFLVLR